MTYDQKLRTYLAHYTNGSTKGIETFLKLGADANEGLRAYLKVFRENVPYDYYEDKSIAKIKLKWKKKFPSIVKLFVKYGADPSQGDNSCLSTALYLDFPHDRQLISCVKALLALPGIDLLKKDWKGETFLEAHIGHSCPKINLLLFAAEKKQIKKNAPQLLNCWGFFRKRSVPQVIQPAEAPLKQPILSDEKKAENHDLKQDIQLFSG